MKNKELKFLFNKKSRFYIFITSLILLIAISCILAFTYGSIKSGENRESNFIVDSKGVLIKYTGEDPQITIPGHIKIIGANAFTSNKNIISVIIPNSVTAINSGAFFECEKLIDIIISDSVTVIYDSVFENCRSIETITLPSNLDKLGNRVFSGCSNLKEISISESNRNFSSSGGILYNKVFSELLYYPAGKSESVFSIPEGVYKIGMWAFEWCTNLQEIVIPDSVKEISFGALIACTALKSIVIPASVVSIGEGAFYYCTELEKAYVPPNVLDIGERCFYRCDKLTIVCQYGSPIYDYALANGISMQHQ